MAEQLNWIPMSEGSVLPDALMNVIYARYFPGTTKSAELTLDNDEDYLEGLVDSGVDGSVGLLAALRSYTKVGIYLLEVAPPP